MEVEHEPWRREGFFFDVASFRSDLYRLISSFYASITFAECGEDVDDDPVRELQGDFEEFEITRLMVSIAVAARIMDERDGYLSSKFGLECGQITPDLSQPDVVEPLSLREACNKIIHARKFNWDVEHLKDEGNLPHPITRFVAPTMFLYGRRDKTEWKATLNITEFVRNNAVLWKG